MSEQNKTTGDLYRELVEMQVDWREENKALLADNHCAIENLNKVRKLFNIVKLLIIPSVLIVVILSVTVLVWNEKIRFCTVTFMDFAASTDSCFLQNEKI
jgi:hypothetical protein